MFVFANRRSCPFRRPQILVDNRSGHSCRSGSRVCNLADILSGHIGMIQEYCDNYAPRHSYEFPADTRRRLYTRYNDVSQLNIAYILNQPLMSHTRTNYNRVL